MCVFLQFTEQRDQEHASTREAYACMLAYRLAGWMVNAVRFGAYAPEEINYFV